VTTGKAFLTVQTVAERPYDPLAKLEASVFEYRVENDVERKHLAVLHMVAHLPAD